MFLPCHSHQFSTCPAHRPGAGVSRFLVYSFALMTKNLKIHAMTKKESANPQAGAPLS